MCFATRFHCLKKTTGERNSYARELQGQKEGLDEKLWAGSDFRSPLNHSNIIPADIHCCSTSLRPVSITALLQL